MIISTPEELRLFMPNHVMTSIESMMGFFDNSEHDFLAKRIGKPLLAYLNDWYAKLNDEGLIEDEETAEFISAIVSTARTPEHKRDTMQQFLLLCQRCVVFDAYSRAANIQTVSLNEAGLNVPESQGYDAAGDKVVDKYKSQLNIEAHAAVNRLLEQLEEWQKEVALAKAEAEKEEEDEPAIALFSEGNNDPVQDTTTNDPSNDPTTGTNANDPSTSLDPNDGEEDEEEQQDPSVPGNPVVGQDPKPQPTDSEVKARIVELWKESDYYYYADGLLFNTATEFNLYVDIYNSREKFIQLLPDIRYCQEVHLEAELSPELLGDLIEKRRNGVLNKIERKAYIMLQRTLSLMVEARSKVIGRKEAKDEATGNLRNTLGFIRKHQLAFDREAIEFSPFYDECVWLGREYEDEAELDEKKRLLKEKIAEAMQRRSHPKPMFGFEPAKPCDIDPTDPRLYSRPRSEGMFISSLI